MSDLNVHAYAADYLVALPEVRLEDEGGGLMSRLLAPNIRRVAILDSGYEQLVVMKSLVDVVRSAGISQRNLGENKKYLDHSERDGARIYPSGRTWLDDQDQRFYHQAIPGDRIRQLAEADMIIPKYYRTSSRAEIVDTAPIYCGYEVDCRRLAPHADDVVPSRVGGSSSISIPTISVDFMLRALESDARSGGVLDRFRCERLADLAASYVEIVDRLWQKFDSCSPKVQWLLMDVLASHRWEELSRKLVERMDQWNVVDDRPALIGVLLVVRRNPLAWERRNEFKSKVVHLINGITEGLEGRRDPLQEELIVHAVATLGSFASGEDVDLLHRLSMGDYSYEVVINSMRALARVVARYPSSREVFRYFEDHGSDLVDKIEALILVRSVSEKNGALLWTALTVLFARLGEEVKLVMPIAERYPQLVPRMMNLFREARAGLIRLDHREWVAGGSADVVLQSLSEFRQGRKSI